MKAKEIRELTADQLQEKLKELDLQVFNSRFNAKMGQQANSGDVRKARKDIARIKTVLTQRGVKN